MSTIPAIGNAAKLDDLEEVGQRAPWLDDVARRRHLLAERNAWRIARKHLRTRDPAHRLAILLYRAGPFVLPPAATLAEILEGAAECFAELCGDESRPNFGPN